MIPKRIVENNILVETSKVIQNVKRIDDGIGVKAPDTRCKLGDLRMSTINATTSIT